MTLRSLGLVAALSLVGTAVAACSSDSSEVVKTLPPLSQSSSVAATPRALATNSSPDARKYIGHYFDEINRSIKTGRVSRLAAYSRETCACRALVADISNVYRAGSYSGGHVTLRSIQVNGLAAIVLYDVNSAQILDKRRQPTETVPAVHGARDEIRLERIGRELSIAQVVKLN